MKGGALSNKSSSWLERTLLSDTPSSLPIRLRAKIKLQSSTAGVIWDTFQVLLSLTACVLYVVSTFAVGDRTSEVVIELICAFFFLVDLCLNYFIADNRIRFWGQMNTIVDVLTLAPVAITLISDGANAAEGLFFFRMLRVLAFERVSLRESV